MSDNVNHPSHYTDGKIEVIDFIEDKKLGYHLGNAVKYISRAGKKDPDKYIEDLQKAVWYLNREIARKTKEVISDTALPADTINAGTYKVEGFDGCIALDFNRGVPIVKDGEQIGEISGPDLVNAIQKARHKGEAPCEEDS